MFKSPRHENPLTKVYLKIWLNNILKQKLAGDHSGKTIVVTGGSKGIGLEAVKKLLKLKCNVIVGCRSVEHAKSELNDQYEGKLTILYLDLLKLDSVREFASQIKEMNVALCALVNNAGIMFGDRRESEDGYEYRKIRKFIIG